MLGHADTVAAIEAAYRAYHESQGAEAGEYNAGFAARLHRMLIAEGQDAEPDRFPNMDNLSARWLYKFVPVPARRLPPEFVYVPLKSEPEQSTTGERLT